MTDISSKLGLFLCRIRDNAFVIFVLIISGVFWLHRLVKFIYNVCCYWEIRSFYISALKMSMVSQNLAKKIFFGGLLKSCMFFIIVVYIPPPSL